MIMKKIVGYFDNKQKQLKEEDSKFYIAKMATLGLMEGLVDGLLIAAPILLIRVLIDNNFIERVSKIEIK
jgi:hypothetical protein